MRTSTLCLLGCALPLTAMAADNGSNNDWQELDQRLKRLEQQQVSSSAENTSFSLYGSLRPTLVYSDSDITDEWDVGDALSRIGVKGRTEFAPGWALLAQGEWKINLNGDGSFGDARLAFAGVDSPYGQLSFGRQRPVQYTLVAEYTDIFNNANSPFAYNQESPFFADNLALYQFKLQHFTLMASARFDGEGDNSGADAINAGLGFDWQGLHLGVSYLEQDNFEGELKTGKDKTSAAAVAYSFDNGIYLALAYQYKDYQLSGSEDRDGSTLDAALAIPLSQDYKLKLGYFRFDDGLESDISLDYQGFNTTLEWNPASNVRLHLEYLQQDNEQRATDKSIAFGIRYDFDLNWRF
ncbi:MAG: porin [Shewanella indica]|uniref:porin n=2 Tax=Shewanella indica TaxID=768528 RepID=UPI00300432BB